MRKLLLFSLLALPAAAQTWYDASWTYRKPLTIAHTQVSGATDLTSFPVLVSITDTSLQAHALSNGNDILFTSTDGTTKLNHEIEQYNSTTGQLLAWVSVPTLSHTVDTTIYIYYGNSGAASQQSPTAVWTNYSVVWHFGNGTALSATDSTTHGNNGAITLDTATPGQLYGGVNLAGGAGSKIKVASATALPTLGPFTVQAWIKNSTFSSLGLLFGFGDPTSNTSGQMRYWIQYNNHYYWWSAGARDFDTGIAMDTDNQWHQIAATYDGSTLSFVRDGLTLATVPGWNPDTAASIIQAGGNCCNDNGAPAGETLDEARITATPLTSGWLATEYTNQHAPGSFVSIGSEQTAGTTTYVVTSPAGLSIVVDGTPCTAPCSFTWTASSNHTLAATTTQAGATGIQYLFTSWSDAGTAAHSITSSGSGTYTATFSAQYYLTATASPTAGGTVTPASGWYDAGAVVTLTAAPATHFSLRTWSGALSGTTLSQNLTMSAPFAAAANFQGLACASTQAGNWSSPSTWTSCAGGVPADGYTAAVQHAVTVDTSTAIGYSDDGTVVALQVSNPGSLTIASGATLTLHGNMTGTGANANVTINGGGTLLFDSSFAAAPSTTHYKYQVTSTYNLGASAPLLIGNGTLTSGTCTAWATVTSNPAGGYGYIGDAFNGDGGLTQLTCTKLDRLGTATLPAIQSLSDESPTGPPVAAWNHVILTNIAGTVYLSFASQGYSLNYVDFMDPNSTGAFTLKTVAASFNTVTREIRHSSINQLEDYYAVGYIVDDSFLYGLFAPNPSGGYGTQLTNSFVLTRSSGASENYIMPRATSVTGNYLGSDCSTYDFAGHYTAKTACSNSHVFNLDQGTATITQNLFASFTASSQDSCSVYAYGATTPIAATITYNLILPAYDLGNLTGTGIRASCYWNIQGPPLSSIVFEHNTTFGGGEAQGLLSLQEQAPFTSANIITSLRSNLFWSTAAHLAADTAGDPNCRFLNKIAYSPASAYCNNAATQLANVVTNTACDYNAGWQIQTGGLNGKGYAINETAACGAHDLTANPQFVDANRRFATWVKSICSNTLPGNATPDELDWQAWGLYLLTLRNQPTATAYNSQATIPSLIAYLKAGYTPTNTALHNAAADGTDIGALPWQSGASSNRPHGQAIIF